MAGVEEVCLAVVIDLLVVTAKVWLGPPKSSDALSSSRPVLRSLTRHTANNRRQLSSLGHSLIPIQSYPHLPTRALLPMAPPESKLQPDDPSLLPSDEDDDDFTLPQSDSESSSDSDDDESKSKKAKVAAVEQPA